MINNELNLTMDLNSVAEEVGNWRKEKILGAGGFGYVILWRNKENNETIALKQCRWGHDPMMTPKNRTRWKLEVDMMFRLNHSNIVKAIPVPHELDVASTELPLLAMEYCSNGDLRKLLSKPENCCGLPEKSVRLIMKHISSAVNYLHSMRIIHRDLKPENIVIQGHNENVVYKLIDLGYAKELDEGSLCTSFVGTLQYLAPELFMSQKYSCTVDYWSMGLVTHEVITGSCPFLPDKSPAEWIPIIKQKTFSQIRAFLDEDKNIIFSHEIYPFHYISSLFKEDVEKWLQLMLEWDAKKRGRNENCTAFDMLEDILNKKTVSVFNVSSLKIIDVCVAESMSLDDFSKEIHLKLGIPIENQEIILKNGHVPNVEKGVLQFLSNPDEEESMIYLFDKVIIFSSNFASPTIIPLSVQRVMRDPYSETDYLQQREIWSHAVFLSQQECLLFNRLIKAFKASLMHLLTKTSYVHKCISRMTAEMNKLLSKCTFFTYSLEQDLESYEKQAQKNGFVSEELHQDWKNILENVKKIDLVRQKVVNLEACSSTISTHTLELQRSPYARSKVNSSLENTHGKILEAYSDLRKRRKELRRIPQKNTVMVQLLCLCLQQTHTQMQDILSHIRKVRLIKQDIDDCLPQIMNLLKEICDWDNQVDCWQNKRQKMLWKVIDALNEKIHCVERSASPLLLSCSPQSSLPRKYNRNLSVLLPAYASELHSIQVGSLSQSRISPPAWQNKAEPLTSTAPLTNTDIPIQHGSSSSSIPNFESISSILGKASEDSRRLKKENEGLVRSFQNMMSMLKIHQDCETMDHIVSESTHTLKN